ncbi:MAG TPA: hypothetical protein VGK39_04005, partial [Cyclobacteriaceae bacterium]
MSNKLAQYFIAFLLIMPFSMYGQLLVKGQADLSKHNFATAGSVSLSGEWEFYWNKLLTPADFKVDQKPEWFWPYSWNRQSDYPALGFATYRAHVVLPEQHHSLSVFFPVINSSARIWVNGKLMLEVGKVSDDRNKYTPKLSSSVITLPENVKEVELVIQVANWTYFSGGLAGYPKLDSSDTLFADMNARNGVENFFAG